MQHLAPVIEAVSEASNEAEEALDEEEYNLQQQINQQQLEHFNHQQNGKFIHCPLHTLEKQPESPPYAPLRIVQLYIYYYTLTLCLSDLNLTPDGAVMEVDNLSGLEEVNKEQSVVV